MSRSGTNLHTFLGGTQVRQSQPARPGFPWWSWGLVAATLIAAGLAIIAFSRPPQIVVVPATPVVQRVVVTATEPPATAVPTRRPAAPRPTPIPAPPPAPIPELIDSGAPAVGITLQNGTISPPGKPPPAGSGSLAVALLNGVGEPIRDRAVSVWTQKQDVAGRCIADKQVGSASTGQSGEAVFALAAGRYAVRADLDGEGWGNMETTKGQCDVPVQAGRTTQLHAQLGRLIVKVVDTSGLPIINTTVHVLHERHNTAGLPVKGGPIASRNTGQIGEVTFDLAPEAYIVAIDLPGYQWGNLQDGKGAGGIRVQAGQVTPLEVKLGRLVVIGPPRAAVAVNLQRGAGRQAARGEGVASRTIDNTGRVTFDLTPGRYWVTISGNPERTIVSVEVASGQTRQIQSRTR